jgi:RHS repeat-associated protein
MRRRVVALVLSWVMAAPGAAPAPAPSPRPQPDPPAAGQEAATAITNKAVRPILECVVDNGGGSYTAHWGYLSENTAPVTIAVGASNKFTPLPENRGQPTVFQPGRTPYWPNAAFSTPFNGSNLVWTLRGPDGSTRTSTASSSSKRCGSKPLVPILECVRNEGGGSYRAFFGYDNQATTAVSVPVGANNKFSPLPQDRGQPTAFTPGRTPAYPNTPFSVSFNGSTLTWTLKGPDAVGRTAVASSTCVACPADGTPPTVSLVQPGSGAYVASSRPLIRFNYADNPGGSGINVPSVRVRIDGADRTAEFAVQADHVQGTPAAALAEGPHTVAVEVRDLASNLGQASGSFTVDSLPPQVTIVQPVAGEWVSATAVTVAGGVVDASPVTVAVNAVPAGVQASAFTAPNVPVGAGPAETFVATAVDAAGNTGTASVEVRVDRDVPTIAIATPAAGAIVAGPLVDVAGTASDSSPLVIDVNGEAATVTGTGPYSFTARVGVADGAATLTARARDGAGSVNSAQVAVTVDSVAPTLTVTEPVPGAITRATSLAVAGTVSDATAVDLTVNGQGVPVTGGGFSTGVALGAEGPATITVEATDAAGNATRRDVPVAVDRTAPALAVASPAEGARVAAPVLVQGTASDQSGVTVRVDGVPATVTETAWQAEVGGLSDGPHVFSVVAEDPAGNRTTATRGVVIDSGGLAIAITSPAPGTLTAQATLPVAGTVSATTVPAVTAGGLTAAVQPSGPGQYTFAAAAVPLTEGDNRLLAQATDGAGRTASAEVVVTRDSTPPAVALSAPDRLGRGQTGRAVVTVTDAVAVGSVVLRLGGQTLATLQAPPFETDFTVPAGAANGDTLVVSAQATDTAGNTASASRGVRVAGDGLVVGQALSDTTSLPLSGVTVRRLAPSGADAAITTTDARGRYSLPAGAEAVAVLVLQAEGYSGAERTAPVELGLGSVPVDARLTPLAAAVVVGPAGGTLGEATGPLSVFVAAGGLATETEARLTPLSPQGLPGLLPLGFSPAAAFDLRLGASAAAGSLQATWRGLPAAPLLLVQHRPAVHAWFLVASGLLASSGELSAPLPEAGAYALVVADDEPAPPIPPPGAALAGLPMAPIPDTATSAGTVEPAVIPPTGGTARGALTVQSSSPLPSGTVVQAEIRETYRLASGGEASEEPRLEDILLYRRGSRGTACAARLCAEVPITPVRTYAATEITEGTVHLDILAGREAVRGTTGGSTAVVVQDGDVRLAVPAGALAIDTAVSVRRSDLSSFLPIHPALTPLREMVVDFSGGALSLSAELSVASEGLPLDGTLLLARVERVEGVPRLTVVALAWVVADRIVSVPYAGVPGVTFGGRYVFYRVAAPVGFVGGFTRAAGAPVASVVETTALPFVGLAGADARYVVAASAGTHTVSARVPRTTLAGSGVATVVAAQTVALDLDLAGTATTAVVRPAHGTQGVEPGAAIEIEATAPLDPATVATAGVRLLRGDPAANDAMAVRLVLSGSRRIVSVVPQAALGFLTSYTVQASGLRDAFGGAVVAPSATFTTRADAPPAYDFAALVFGFPDAAGLVSYQAPAGSLPPGTRVLIVNAGNGVVVSVTVGNDGSLSGSLPARLSDRLLITLTDPSGNTVSYQRSEFTDPATGRTAIGPGGGTVRGPGGVEMRVPPDALPQAATFRLEGVSGAEIEALFPGQRPDVADATVGSAIRIESAERPTLAREADLAFPLPAGLPPNPRDAFFYVYRRLQGPDGRAAFETLDQAFVEGEGAAARVVTASYPFAGYLSSAGAFLLGANGVPALSAQATNHAILMWTHSQLTPGAPRTGVVTGRVQRVVWDPGAATPTYQPVAGALVTGVDASGQPLFPNQANAGLAVTQTDGTFTLWDPRYQGGPVTIAATADGLTRTATAFQAVPADYATTPLRYYGSIATTTVTFPPVEPPQPPPAVAIVVVRRGQGGSWEATNGLAVAGQELLVGLRTGDLVQGITIQGAPQAVREVRPPDALVGEPHRFAYVSGEAFTPMQAGLLRVTATALPAFGSPVTVTHTLRVVAEGGSNNDPLEGVAPEVMNARTVPPEYATAVELAVQPQVVFTEPVQNVSQAGAVSLAEVTAAGAVPVAFRLFGVGPDGAFESPGPGVRITALTLQPTVGLKFGARYRLGLGPAIGDFDSPATGGPRALLPYQSEFTTFSPGPIAPPGTGETFGSAGIVVLDDRAYLVQNNFTNGLLRAFDVSDPARPREITTARATVAWRPVDVAGEAQSPATGGRMVAVATGSTNQSKPSNVYVFDTRSDAASPWVAGASFTTSAQDGFIFRLAAHRGLVYAASYRKGVQVMNVAQAAQGFPAAGTAAYWQMVQQLNTDGVGFGHQNVVSIPVLVEGQPARLYDLEVGDYVVGGQSQALGVAVGEAGFVVVDPVGMRVLRQGPLVLRAGDGSVVAQVSLGYAVALGRVADRDVAAVVGTGTPGGLGLMVVDLADPAEPQAVGFVPLPPDVAFSPDAVIKDDWALVSGTSSVHVVSLATLSAPSVMGQIQGLAGRLSLGEGGLVFATARSAFGGNDPLGGLRVADLEPGGEGDACGGVADLLTPKVVLRLTIDPTDGSRCGEDGRIVFRLCQPASVTLNMGSGPFTGTLDGQLHTIQGLVLGEGLHVVGVPATVLPSDLTSSLDFTLLAQPTAGGAAVSRTGRVEHDLRNRSVLPVGHTFVKGVDLLDGHVVRPTTDLALPGRHLGVAVTRTYSSAGKGEGGALGSGWSWNLESLVARSSCGLYTVVTADGSSQVFRSTDGTTFIPQRGYHTRLQRNADSSLTFTDKSGTKHRFVSPGDLARPTGVWRLESVEEPHGDRLVATYDGQGRLVSLGEVPRGQGQAVRSLHFTYVHVAGLDRVRTVSAMAGATDLRLDVTYDYDAATGSLLAATRTGDNVAGQPPAEPRVERYEYSASDPRDRHQLTAVVDPNGNRTEYVYYTATDPFPGESPTAFVYGKQEFVRQVREFPAPGDLTQVLTTLFAYDYSQAGSAVYPTTVTDPRGYATVYRMNGDGSPTRIEEPLGKATTAVWAPADVLKLSETDPLGRLTEYGYDARGNLTRETIRRSAADPAVLAETTYEYDPAFNKLTRKVDAEGRQTSYVIDPVTADLREWTDGAGNRTVHVYDAAGQLLRTTDPRGFVTTHAGHDGFGHPTLVTDPLGSTTQRTHDARGRLVREASSLGAQTGTSPLVETTWDGLDRVVSLRRAAGGGSGSADETTQTAYFPGGEPRRVTTALGTVTESTLDGLSRVVATRATVPEPDGTPQVYTTAASYDGSGNRVSETDRRGVVRQLTYDALNRLSEVRLVSGPSASGPAHRVVAAYEYDLAGNRVAETDLYGRRTELVHDGLYRVVERRLPLNDAAGQAYRERFEHDRVGNRTASVDPNGRRTEMAYDSLNRLVRTARDPGGLNLVTAVVYDDYGSTPSSHVLKSEERDEARGLRTIFRYDALGREVRREVRLEKPDAQNPTVYVTTTAYDDPRHEQKVTDPRGTPRRTRRDGLGRLIEEEVDPAGLGLLTRTSYDGLGGRTSVTDPRGNVTVHAYDGLGRLVRTTDALGQVMTYAWDGADLKTEETDRRGVRRTFTHDNLGRPLRTDVPGVPSLSGVAWSREVQYLDEPVGGAVRRVERDALGRATTYELDGLDRVVRVTDARGQVLASAWDGVNRVSETDRRGSRRDLLYDAVNRLVRVTDPAVSPEGTRHVEATAYDDANNRQTVTDRRGLQTMRQEDPLGRLVSVTRRVTSPAARDVVLEAHTYDGNGNRLTSRDAEGRETRVAYDAANRLSSRTDGYGTAVAAVTTFAYDPSGNPVEERDARAALLGEPFSVRRAYDALDRLESVTDGEGLVTRYDYDGEGNRMRVTEPLGQATDFAYDELGRLARVVQAPPVAGAPRPETAYAYDAQRNRVRQTDARGSVVEMAYDELDRLVTTTQDPGGLGLVTTRVYDANGNLTELRDAKGQVTTSTWDELNRLRGQAFTFAPGDPVRPWRHTTSVAYRYDGSGNLLQADESVASGTDPPSVLTTTRAYDDLDRLVSETAPLPDGGTRTVGYGYYDNGTRERVSDPSGRVTRYTYDGQNRLASATTDFGTAQAATTTYAYLPDGLRREVSQANGVVAVHGYDRADRLVSLVNTSAGATVSSYAYTYDGNGNRLTQTEANGGLTEATAYAYDGLNRLLSVTYPADGTFPAGRVLSYGYDAVGNRLRETTLAGPGGAVLADEQGVFDSLNRLLALNDLLAPANSTVFAWDANGNQTSKTVGAGTPTLFRYDTRDKLVEATQGASVLGRFQYDFDGRRTKKIGEEGVRQYLYDETSLFAEYDGTGAERARYAYGSDRLLNLTRADEPRRYFSLDGLRSVVNLTSDDGSVAASYHLDPWGNYRFPQELDSSKNRFGFTGYELDKETGLYNAKARYLDPEVGRFTTADSFLGNIDDPPSLHRFVYAANRPTYFVDPTGHAPEEAGKKVYVCDVGGCRAEIQRPPSTEQVVAPQPITSDVEARYPAWLNEALAEARKRRLERGLPAEEPVAPRSAERTVTEDLGLESTGDPAADAILKQRKDTKAALRKVGEYGKAAGEFGLSVGAGTAGDVATATTGIDPVTGEKVDRLTRGMAVAGAIIPGLSGRELKAAKELAEEAAKARKPFRELLNADELRRFEQLKQKYPDFMPDPGAAARVLTPAEVREARKQASRGGHHRHPLAFEGEPKPAEGLVPTGDTRQGKGPEHKEVTNFWSDVLRRLRSEEKK